MRDSGDYGPVGETRSKGDLSGLWAIFDSSGFYSGIRPESRSDRTRGERERARPRQQLAWKGRPCEQGVERPPEPVVSMDPATARFMGN